MVEHKLRFPNDYSMRSDSNERAKCIQVAARDENGPGLYETINHWTDLALELWGDLIDPFADLRIGLMVIGTDAYAFAKTRNVGLHRYWDEIPAWRNLWICLLNPLSPGFGKYRTLAGRTVGEISDVSPLGKFMRSRMVWPTNALAHFRGWPNEKDSLPIEALNDKWSIHLLAYQIFLLNPRHVLILGGQAPDTVEAAYRLLEANKIKRPKTYQVPHPSYSGFWSRSREILDELRYISPVVGFRKDKLIAPPSRETDTKEAATEPNTQTAGA